MAQSDGGLIARVVLASVGLSLLVSVGTIAMLAGPFGEIPLLVLAVLGLAGWIVLIVRWARGHSAGITFAAVALGTFVAGVVSVLVVILAFMFGVFGVLHGRPLRGAKRRARVRVGPPRAGQHQLGLVARLRVGVGWAADATLEADAVAAFDELAERLERTGAPEELVARARMFARQEEEHAQLCSTLASEALGREIRIVPARSGGGSRDDALVALAVEAFEDGCLGEGFAARVAHDSAGGATRPAVRDILRRIADEEAQHAEHAWDVLAFCVRRGGTPVRRALAASSVALHRRRPIRLPRADRVRAAWGRPAEPDPGATYCAVRTHVRRRLDALLATS